MTSTLVTDYLGRGVLADRPDPPPVAAEALAIYFATDVPSISRWDGAAWVPLMTPDEIAKLDFSGLPISPSGLTAGQIWLNSGVMTVV